MNENNRPSHCANTKFSIKNGELLIGGNSISQLAMRVGSTPFYAYDRNIITDQVTLLRRQLPKEIHLHYAMKANPMPAVVQHLSKIVDGIDVASQKEMLVALDTGIDSHNISFAGPGKSEVELKSAIASGVILNVESNRELLAIQSIGQKIDIKPKIAIRINPNFELKGSSMKMGGGPKQFGIDAEKIPSILKELNPQHFDFEGFHIFSGSQNLRADSIADAQEKALALAYELAPYAPTNIKSINIGGGFGIPYFPGDLHLDTEFIGKKLYERIPEVKKRLPLAKIVIELGRFLVGESGVYICRVIEKKISREQTYLIVDGGLHHHLAASGNFGQIIRKNYPVAVGNRMNCEQKEIVSVVGPLCTPLDLLADKMELPKAEEGDLIVIFQSGAYGLTASPTNFLSHFLPKEIVV
jgi:diaminopimelate decarboxylase